MNPCDFCPHDKNQHDEDGFCEVEDGAMGFCTCPGYAEKKEHVT